MTEQGYPPRQPQYPGRQGRSRPSQPPRRTGWQVLDAFDDSADHDSDLPPWAVPGGIEPVRAARRSPRAGDHDPLAQSAEYGEAAQYPITDQPRPARPGRKVGRSRAAAARRRRSKRRLVTWGGTAIVIVLLVGAGLWLTRSPAPKSQFVTTFQKGEFRTVPDACKVIGTTELRALLKGTPTKVEPYRGTTSQCTYTVDKKPTFRVLTLWMQAYPASLTAPGNGGATANARFSFGLQRNLLAKPPKRTAQPPATITSIHGLGEEALSAVQILHTGQLTDWVSVLVRYRNVVIKASLIGDASGGFGPVTVGELQAGALSVAKIAFAAVKAQPTVG